MTLRELIELLGNHPALPLIVLAGAPVIAFVLGYLHKKGAGGESPWNYVYSVLVYVACVPGIFAAVLTGYALFFTEENLLDVNVIVYLAPIISMVFTLIFVRKNVPFDRVPGFGRLSGLMAMIGAAFVIVLAIQRTRIWLFFGGSLTSLVLLALFIFGLMKWGAYMLVRGKDDPERERPSFPEL